MRHFGSYGKQTASVKDLLGITPVKERGRRGRQGKSSDFDQNYKKRAEKEIAREKPRTVV